MAGPVLIEDDDTAILRTFQSCKTTNILPGVPGPDLKLLNQPYHITPDIGITSRRALYLERHDPQANAFRSRWREMSTRQTGTSYFSES